MNPKTNLALWIFKNTKAKPLGQVGLALYKVTPYAIASCCFLKINELDYAKLDIRDDSVQCVKRIKPYMEEYYYHPINEFVLSIFLNE